MPDTTNPWHSMQTWSAERICAGTMPYARAISTFLAAESLKGLRDEEWACFLSQLPCFLCLWHPPQFLLAVS